ncbi:hypothetical protein [Alkalicoccus saliphilus]|uniref:DUF2642 domain-containing protein n=1 Tax=Alkalicoccus saliphilus TaxID=200989 RepID=A0A2T4U956_9BACI|nr:hypothetical protein [Alkalicoccus saliphilus]PTL39931.1 hypothetical protein C6Y45_02815 [Alkalicoccus saliphilus]
MAEKILHSYIGQQCKITTLLGEKVSGEIKSIEGKWIELQVGKAKEFVNTEYVERIKLTDPDA